MQAALIILQTKIIYKLIIKLHKYTHTHTHSQKLYAFIIKNDFLFRFLQRDSE